MSIFDIQALDIDGNEVSFAKFKGKTLLIVNVASKCGFTPQYEGLEKLYLDLKDRGLLVLGFPCNQFGAQEPGSDTEIKQFCGLTYNVTFPIFAKVDVNGGGTHPLFKLLKSEASGFLGTEGIKWNFTKFLVDKTGKVVRRYAPTVTPESLRKDIEAIL